MADRKYLGQTPGKHNTKKDLRTQTRPYGSPASSSHGYVSPITSVEFEPEVNLLQLAKEKRMSAEDLRSTYLEPNYKITKEKIIHIPKDIVADKVVAEKLAPERLMTLLGWELASVLDFALLEESGIKYNKNSPNRSAGKSEYYQDEYSKTIKKIRKDSVNKNLRDMNSDVKAGEESQKSGGNSSRSDSLSIEIKKKVVKKGKSKSQTLSRSIDTNTDKSESSSSN